jgi:hypothetical protein
MDWAAEIGCEGGPVLVANAVDFQEWTGAIPFPLERRKQLLFYSPFTRELPERFRTSGDEGHLYLDSSDPSKLREELIAAALELYPESSIDRSEEQWVFTRSDGKRLFASLEPSSEYDLAIRELGHEGIHVYGGGRSCYLWSVEPGLVLVSVRCNNTVLLLAQVCYADGDRDVAAAYKYAESHVPTDCAGIAYDVGLGDVVVAWSPQAAADMEFGFNIGQRTSDIPGELLNLVTAKSGAAIRLQPGRYTTRTEYIESPSWGLSWCLLTRDAE